MSVVVNIWPEDLETWSAISLVGAFDKSKLLLNFCRNFEDPSDIIEDVVEISVENSVEVNLLPVNNNSEV